MIVSTIAFLSATIQDRDSKLLTGHNLKLMNAIVSTNFRALKPYIRGNVRIQHIGNCYSDHNAVFAKRFSNAQLERTWHAEVRSANLNLKTPPRAAIALLKEFSRDVGDQMDGVVPDVWYPQTFDSQGSKGIASKIASGAFYIFELDSVVKKPRIIRLWDLDHTKGWEDFWHNRKEE